MPDQNNNTGVTVEELEFEATPTSVIVEAIRKYEESQEELRPVDEFSAEETWNYLAHQVVGHETRPH